MKSSLWPKLLVALVAAAMMVSVLPRGVPARVLATPPAGATTITFDDLPITGEPGGLLVSDWYSGQGILFNNAIAENYGHLPGFSHSGFTGIHQCESSQINACNTPLIMTFPEPQWYVGLWLGFADSLSVPAQVTLTAYNAEIAGDVVNEDSVWIGPSQGGFIPVNTELEVDAPEAGPPETMIRRVEVGFVDDHDLTADLIFDNVAFAHGGRGGFLGRTCPAGTTPPTVVLRQPVSGKTTKANSFDLNSSVTPRDDLTEATLTAESDRGEKRTRSIFDTVFTPGDPNFGKATIANLLFPGVNRVTLDVFNCAGPGTASAAIEYRPSTSNTRYNVLGLEVTQAIQDLDNTVPLVAGKRTFVRVYLATTGSSDIFTDVTAYLTGCRVASESAATCDAPLGRIRSRNAITVDSLAAPPDLTAKRQKMRSALLFELPPHWWREGLLRLALDGASLSPALPCDGCDNLTAAGAPHTYRFQPADPLTLNIVSVGFTQGEIRYVPSAKDRQFLESWLRRAYPTSAVNSVWLVGEINFLSRPSCADVGVAMFHEWAIANATGGWDITPTRYYGMVPLIDARDATNRGCALIGTTDKAADAERPYNDHYASGPSGTDVDFTWDRDGSFADFYGAHEIAHTLGRLHPGWCDDSAPDDLNPEAADFRGGAIGGNDKKFMGFDAGDGRFETLPRRLYRGDLWFDVMSYCDRIWISPYTYEALLSATPTPTPTPVETPTPPAEIRTPVMSGHSTRQLPAMTSA